jgi:hypothetical protein
MDGTAELDPLVSEMSRRHPVFPPATIERLVRRTFDEYREAKITTYVPLLVRRAVAAQLRYLDDGTWPVVSPPRSSLTDLSHDPTPGGRASAGA